jgi:hypothetical protein
VSIPHFCRNSSFWTILVKICSLRCTANCLKITWNWANTGSPLKQCVFKHSTWLYMLRFIATFHTNWHMTPWQHNTSIKRNKLWNSFLVCAIRHCSPACLGQISDVNDTQWSIIKYFVCVKKKLKRTKGICISNKLICCQIFIDISMIEIIIHGSFDSVQ